MQSRKNLKGEVRFRKAVFQQDLGKIRLDGWYTREQVREIIRDRVNYVSSIYMRVMRDRPDLDPVLELAAGRCQLSSMLTSMFDARVYATDISFEALDSAAFFCDLLGFSATPIRVQCNIEKLPFRDNSFKHVLIWASLHHFQDPTDVLLEARRVLANQGTLFIGGEPIRPFFQLPLFKSDRENPSLILRLLWKLGISPFFTYDSPLEEDYGIVENSFTANQWRRFLSRFGQIIECDISTNDAPRFLNNRVSARILASIFGGSIDFALLRVNKNNGVLDRRLDLICRNCENKTILLRTDSGSLLCPTCNKLYPIRNGIITILSDDDENAINDI